MNFIIAEYPKKKKEKRRHIQEKIGPRNRMHRIYKIPKNLSCNGQLQLNAAITSQPASFAIFHFLQKNSFLIGNCNSIPSISPATLRIALAAPTEEITTNFFTSKCPLLKQPDLFRLFSRVDYFTFPDSHPVCQIWGHHSVKSPHNLDCTFTCLRGPIASQRKSN